MTDILQNVHPVLQALLATCFTWGLTALGAACVFIGKDINKKALDGMLGFAAGVMVAASFWSLLAPAIDMAEESGVPGWLPGAVGFPLGGAAALALGIGLQNFPEGAAVSVPLRREGFGRLKSFWFGQLSGTVEPA